jgi:hypothetical protein
MISEEELLAEIKKGIKECQTTHLVIIDSKQCRNFKETSLKN